jgi:hypothetical protein
MTTEKLNGTVYEVHSFVVALPCGHNDTLEVRVREADPDKEDYLADCIAATEAGKNAALPVCRRCLPTYKAPEPKVNVVFNITPGTVITGGQFVPPDPDDWTARKKAIDQIYADFMASKGRP